MRRLSYFMNIVTEQMDRNEENGNHNRDTFRELTREYSVLEIEAAQWMAIYGSRQRERDDIRAGIFLMYELRRQRLKERDTIRRELDIARRDLPSCVVRRASLPRRAPSLCGPVLVLIPHRVPSLLQVLLKSIQEGVREAAALNTVVAQGSFDALLNVRLSLAPI